MEIERKWLVDKAKVSELLLKGAGLHRERLEQYYLNTMDDEWLIRIRMESHEYFLTLKSKGLLSREELQVQIAPTQFQDMLKYAKSGLKKWRYNLPIDFAKALYAEIDIYDDYDFITCEVEFKTEEESKAFIPPEWCVKEVTNDKQYKNVNLAKKL